MGFPSWLCFDTMEASSQTGTRENGGTLAANVESVDPALCHTCGTNHGSHHPSPTHVCASFRRGPGGLPIPRTRLDVGQWSWHTLVPQVVRSRIGIC
jgi:hypothetical protein